MVKLIFIIIISVADGGVPGEIFNYGFGARTFSIGKAFTGIAEGIEAIYYNPAGLASLNSNEMLFLFTRIYGDVYCGQFGFGFPTKKFGVFGLGAILNTLNGLEGRDAYGAYTGDFNYNEVGVLIGYGYTLWYKYLQVGLNAKIFQKKVSDWGGVGVGVDGGILILPYGPVSIGFMASNIYSSKVCFEREEERLPHIWRVGLAFKGTDKVRIGFDFYKSENRGWKFGGGVEYKVGGILNLRSGLDNNEVGFGVGIFKDVGRVFYRLDYALNLHHASSFTLPLTHKISLTIGFGGFRVWAEASPKIISPAPEIGRTITLVYIHYFLRFEPKKWKLEIRNWLNEVVRTYQSWGRPPLRVDWDGRDANGKIVPDGKYYYYLEIWDVKNNIYTNKGFLLRVKSVGPVGKVRIEKKIISSPKKPERK